MNDIPTRKAFLPAQTEEMKALAAKAGVVDHAQLAFFVTLDDDTISKMGTTSLRGLSEDEIIALSGGE